MAQNVNRRPSQDGYFNPVQPGQNQNQRPSSDGWFNPQSTARQSPAATQSEPSPPDEQPTPMPPDDQANPENPDTGVTATPLPAPEQDASPAGDPSQQMVPNPLDNPAAPPAQGGTKQGQATQGQAQRGGWVQMSTATLQALDKVNARSTLLVVKVGDTGHFGSLDIVVRGCYVRTVDRPPDATAFVVIRDQRADSPAFTGWMVRSAPSMSMLAHPIYDIRVAGCS
jgi:hypothetical protein